ncbi:MAG: hypothetical protein JRI23_09785 [Deltaproteobacteria bacterium]|nr:hypothetical protein [Deltaproteobacteria bacterium]MBW2531958.1 hypothetical protein [Deltaproteobacteria bacterium]
MDDGSCVPAGATAGVPAESCAEGFIADSVGGCQVVLPQAMCPDGQIALPGDAACHEIMPCGSAPWGEIPIEDGTIFVDGSYGGPASDGTEQAPWTTIGDAVDAAAAGSLIAIAAGSYAEDVRIEGTGLRLWGRCPSMSAIVGVGVQAAALTLIGADGAEVHGIALRGPRVGLTILDSSPVQVSRSWIHDTGSEGLGIKASTVTLQEVLVEAATAGGILAQAATVFIHRSAVRETNPDEAGLNGYGVVVQIDPVTDARAQVEIEQCVIEHNRSVGIQSIGSDLQVRETVVRDTLPDAARMLGHGVNARLDVPSGQRSTLELRQSVVERSGGIGLSVTGSHALVDGLTLRGVAPRVAGGGLGWGLAVSSDAEDEVRADIEMVRSLVEHTPGSGVVAAGADATFQQVLVRDTAAAGDGFGRGFEIYPSPNQRQSTATIRASHIDGAANAGVLAVGSTLVLEATAVTNMQLGADGRDGYGVAIQSDALTGARGVANLRWCSVDSAIGVGVFLHGADGIVEDSIVRRTSSDSRGLFGVGVCGQYADGEGGASTLRVISSRIEESREAGVIVLGSEATIEDTTIVDTWPSLFGQLGDGISVAALAGRRSAATVDGTRVERSGRAGIASFSSTVDLLGNTLECNTVQLDGEQPTGEPYTFNDLGGNTCGCEGALEQCRVLSSNLEPPRPVD